MSNSLSLTIHPASVGAEYLSVSDAMRQILDIVEALERVEVAEGGTRQIVWRLTEAHTNSPPFTVTTVAFPVNPVVSVGLEASRLIDMFSSGVRGLLEGEEVDWIDHNIAIPLKRLLHRNLNGIGRTEIAAGDEAPLEIVPGNAMIALSTLERADMIVEAALADYARTEYGAVEVEIDSITRWNDKPALRAIERLSRVPVMCVLTRELSDELATHQWGEAWEGRRILVSGALHYSRDGELKRIDADSVEGTPWTDVELSQLRGIDILDGRSVTEHLNLMRGGGYA